MTENNSPMTQPTTDYAIESEAEKPMLPSAQESANQLMVEVKAPKKDYALITGASSGIGEAFARELAAKGKPLILIARNEQKLKSLAAELREAHKIDVRFIAINLARSKDLPQLPGKLARMGINIDILINNAGFGKSGPELTIDYEDSLNMVNLNCRSVLALTKLFAPLMAKRKKGAIINVASMAGFLAMPNLATYAATKAFVISFTEALAKELKPSGVKVLCVAPGPTLTNFFKTAGYSEEAIKKMPMEDPAAIAKKSIEALKNGETLLLTTKQPWFYKLGARWLPKAILDKIKI